VRVVSVSVKGGLPSVSSRNSGHFEFRPYDSLTKLNSGATGDARRASVAARDLVAMRLRNKARGWRDPAGPPCVDGRKPGLGEPAKERLRLESAAQT
jgi:hypothetical protein